MTWIKIRTNLPTDPAVLRIAAATRINALEVVGRLFLVWTWADGLTVDGTLPNAKLEDIDAISGRRGFGAAMQQVNWLGVTEGGLELPKWDRHNGASAKRRAMESERKRQERAAPEPPCPHPMRTECGQNADTMRTREEEEEKRREENKTKTLFSRAGAREGPGELLAGETQAAKPHWTADTGWTGISEEAKGRWRFAYPACDVEVQLAKMDVWLRANPDKAHKSRWERFVVTWLSHAQDRGGDVRAHGGRHGQRVTSYA